MQLITVGTVAFDRIETPFGVAEKTVGGTVNPNPVFSGSVCTVANINNWGSATPSNPCFNYFPIIYSPSDLHISSSGEGQGILLVGGDLDVSGGFNFYGVAIVMGTIAQSSV